MKDDGLRDLFRVNLRDFDFQSVEMFLLASGVPDVNGCRKGVEFWIEMKRTSATAVAVRPGQVAWIERRLRHGGRVFVAVRQRSTAGPRRGAARDVLWLLSGAAIRRLADGGLDAVDRRHVLAVFDGGPAAWDWRTVADRLVGADT
jgi:hypothetical protein